MAVYFLAPSASNPFPSFVDDRLIPGVPAGGVLITEAVHQALLAMQAKGEPMTVDAGGAPVTVS